MISQFGQIISRQHTSLLYMLPDVMVVTPILGMSLIKMAAPI